MPREYRTQAAPGGPSPTGFGAADINLQTPRFVAQTAVDAGVNPFEELQRILGLGVEVAGRTLSIESQRIEGLANVQRAKQYEIDRAEAKVAREQAKVEREQAKADRAEREKAARLQAELRAGVSKATTPEEAEKIGKESLAGIRTETSTEEMTARVQVAEAAETQARELRNEKERSEKEAETAYLTGIKLRAEQSAAIGDIKALDLLQTDLLTKATEAPDSEKLRFLKAQDMVSIIKDSVEADTEKQAREEENVAKAENEAAFKYGQSQAAEVVASLASNLPEASKLFEEVSSESLLKALTDHVAKYTLYNGDTSLLENASEAARNAYSAGIMSVADNLVNTLVADRNRRAVEKAVDVSIDASAAEARAGNIENAIGIIANTPNMTGGKAMSAVKAAGAAYIDGSKDNVEAVTRFMKVMSDPTVDDGVKGAVLKAYKEKRIDGVVSQMNLERQKAMSEPGAVGFASRYNSSAALRADALVRFGVTEQDLEDSGSLRQIVEGELTKLTRSFDADNKRLDEQVQREKTAYRAMDPTKRRKMSISDNFNNTALYESIKADPQNPLSYRNMNADQIGTMLEDALVGYQDSEIPTAVADVLKSPADKTNLMFIREFWKRFNPANNSAIGAQLIKSAELQDSFAIGMFMAFRANSRQNPSDEDYDDAAAMATNLVAMRQPLYQDENKQQLKDRVDTLAVNLANGVGLDTGSLDFFGVEPSSAIRTMSPSDQVALYAYAQIAASVPNENAEFFTHVLRENGVRVYQIGDNYNLVQSLPVRAADGTIRTPLPEPDELDTDAWTAYMKFKASAAQEAINKRPQRPEEVAAGIGRPSITVKSVRLDPGFADIAEGYCSLRAVDENGIEYRLSVDEARVYKEEFYEFRKTWKPSLPEDTGYKIGHGGIPR